MKKIDLANIKYNIRFKINKTKFILWLENEKNFNKIDKNIALSFMDKYLIMLMKKVRCGAKMTLDEQKAYTDYAKKYFKVDLDRILENIESRDFLRAMIDPILGDTTDEQTKDFLKKEFGDIFDNEILSRIGKDDKINDKTLEYYISTYYPNGNAIKHIGLDKIQEILFNSISEDENVRKLPLSAQKFIEYFIDCGLLKDGETIENDEEMKIISNVICEYLNKCIIKDENALINNNALAHLVATAEKGRLGENLKKTIEDILENGLNRSQIEEPDMGKYRVFISKFIRMPDRYLEDFCRDVIKIRNKNGIIPKEFCEYLLAMGANKWYEMDNLMQLIDRAEEDYTDLFLKENGIENCEVKVLDEDYFYDYRSFGNCGGWLNPQLNEIQINRKNGIMYNIKTIFHEATHAIQRANLNKKIMKYVNYLLYKESLMYQKYQHLHEKNYFNKYEEIDARIKAESKTKKFLEKINYRKIDKKQFKRNIKNEIKRLKEAKFKYVTKDTKAKINVEFQHFILSNSEEYAEFLENNPDNILNNEFEIKNGQVVRRSYKNMLELYESQIKEAEPEVIKTISNFYSGLFSEDAIIYNPLKEILGIIEFQSEDVRVNAMKKRVIFRQVPKMLKQIKRKYKIDKEADIADIEPQLQEIYTYLREYTKGKESEKNYKKYYLSNLPKNMREQIYGKENIVASIENLAILYKQMAPELIVEANNRINILRSDFLSKIDIKRKKHSVEPDAQEQ